MALPGDRTVYEWEWGHYPDAAAAATAYNRLYPDGKRSGIVGDIQPVIDEDTGEVLHFALWLKQVPR